ISIPLPFNVNPLFTVTERTVESVIETANEQNANPYTVTPDIPSMDYTDAWASGTTQEGATESPSTITPNFSSMDYTSAWTLGEMQEGATLTPPQVSFVFATWVVGMIGLALFFLITHYRHRKEYKAAFPVKNDYVNKWLQAQKLRRSVRIRYTDRIKAPMTYGLWKPVILFPVNTNWQDEAQLSYVLTHELTHIKRFDILTKWLLAVALCVHWFNPLVWAMYILANRDIEFACDETVVWTFGETSKSAYADTLIGLEERRSGFSPLYNNFAKNAIKERIEVIMKLKKRSIFGAMVAIMIVALMAAVPLMGFAQSADVNVPAYSCDAYGCCGDAPIFVDPDTGEIWVGIDSRLSENFPWGIDVLYSITVDGVERTKWICHGYLVDAPTTSNISRMSDGDSGIVAEVEFVDFYVLYELIANLPEGGVISRVDGGEFFIADINVVAMNTANAVRTDASRVTSIVPMSGNCTRPGCNGILRWNLQWGAWRPVSQVLCTHGAPFGVDVLYERIAHGFLYCDWCGAFHGGTTIFTDSEWRCRGQWWR
ncbi:MAG: M56 family metallopeptidase, partial [Defluviitaleaceae bacterium]|nr:M56 family metallopeptidase [Defluviitaleaceae bacterium]